MLRMNPLVLVGAASILTLAGCVQLMAPKAAPEVRAFASPLAQESSLFYPLDIGNHWGYENTLSIVITPTGGTPGDPSVFESALDVDLVGTEERFGRQYTVQRESDPQNGYSSDFLYRQDKTGLFNADPEPSTSARAHDVDAIVARLGGAATPSVQRAYRAAAARLMVKQAALRTAALHGARSAGIGAIAEALSGEITLLRYPLAVSKSWHVREDPLFVYTVEGQETIDLPAGRFSGWRIRIDSELFGPDVAAHVWYGHDGLLRLELQAAGEITDDTGAVIGTMVSDQIQALSEISLVKKNPS